jgi:hypothetical protein
MRLSLISVVLVAVGAVACGSDPAPVQRHGSNTPPADDQDNAPPGPNDTKPPADPGTPPPVGTPEPPGTWADGHVVSGNINIPAGTTVTIAAGAQIKIAPDAAITVAGELIGTAGATHAKLAPTSGTWSGLVVAQGGKLTLDSVDIAAAKIGIWTQKSNVDATYANGTMDANQPFQMEAGSKLSVSKSTVKAAAASALAGTFNASYMTYDKGTSEGLYMNDAAGSMTFSDSTLKGAGGGDYIVSSAATLIKVEYTTITGSHCPFHFSAPGPAKYEVDHISDDTNGYGWMLYGSGAGPHTISNSNFTDSYVNIEMTGTNGKVTLTNNFFINGSAGANKLQTAATVASTANARIANAKPR